AHALGRVRWIAHVVGRVVIAEAHGNFRALRQGNRIGISIITLPVEVPILDEDERFDRAIRQRGVSRQLVPEIMRMWKNSRQLRNWPPGVPTSSPASIPG